MELQVLQTLLRTQKDLDPQLLLLHLKVQVGVLFSPNQSPQLLLQALLPIRINLRILQLKLLQIGEMLS